MEDDTKPEPEEAERPQFIHHKLDAYQQSRKFATGASQLAEQIPRGYGKITDQLRRSAIGVPLLIAEAANRRSRAQKRQRFEEALGEVGEGAAAIEVALDLDLISDPEALPVLRVAGRVAAMLVRLEQKYR